MLKGNYNQKDTETAYVTDGPLPGGTNGITYVTEYGAGQSMGTVMGTLSHEEGHHAGIGNWWTSPPGDHPTNYWIGSVCSSGY